MPTDPPERCATCPVEPGLPCRGLETPSYCRHAQHNPAMRAILIKHARQLAGRQDEAPPVLLDPAEAERLRAAEGCPHRDCVGCGCKGCRCLEGGRRPGQVVTIRECLECVEAEGA